MSEERSVSKAAEAVREQKHESNRKKTSAVKSLKSNPSEHFTRKDRTEVSVGGMKNLGSNRNAGRNSEQEDVAHGTNIGNGPEQTDGLVRRPMQPSEAGRSDRGGQDNRKMEKSAVAERHVQSEHGFAGGERRQKSVLSNRAQTAKTFDSLRKSTSSI